jgi:hypothetical protein
MINKNWKTIVKSDDVEALEKRDNDISIRIEARMRPDNTWEIIKRYYNSEINYTEEFKLDETTDLKSFLTVLKKKNLDIKELRTRQLLKGKRIRLIPRREFKEYNLEKWSFTINDEPIENSVMIRFTDTVDIDLYVFEKFSCVEDKIINEIAEVFGLTDPDIKLNYNIFYFSSRSTREVGSQSKEDINWLLGQLDSDDGKADIE